MPAARTGPSCCLVCRTLLWDKHNEFLCLWVRNISWLFDVLWQYGRWPFPLLALLIIWFLVQQHLTADWKETAFIARTSSCSSLCSKRAVQVAPMLSIAAPSLTCRKDGCLGSATARAWLCCHAPEEVRVFNRALQPDHMPRCVGGTYPSQAAFHHGCN